MGKSILKNHIKNYTNLSEEKLTEILSFLIVNPIKKKKFYYSQINVVINYFLLPKVAYIYILLIVWATKKLHSLL